MHKFRMTALGLVLAFGTGSAALAAGLSHGDATFLEEAADAGQLEISASQIALQKSTRTDIKDFAQMMVDDHTKVANELQSLATSKGAKLPAEPSRKVSRKVNDLQKKTGADFDKEYAKEIGVDAHEDAVKKFEKASKNADDADVKAWAAKTLPSLQAHLAKGRQLRDATK
ncbi:hypothetical protein GCM10023144_17970 [Pigmentiphaga soli]|uniref:DUF4142 domain-containing protein n=1 Tax=Pigmentiphaga soli TaxID=1007095 RepID=A0ABP8GV68_9BURK